MFSVHGQVTETKLIHIAIYINIKKYQNRDFLKESLSLMGLIILSSSHYLSMKAKKGAISSRILVELGT